ncbi:hypothetical protein FB567DRAFT_590472 [Paraphoma chrysanthemicola]|uniref:DUF1330 domain-containing protein n=1 Tax=Paraphoma chrysanthemicola TaxID=798071 RepID=A0A8K0R8Z0_9PLEO|nr:hypothetical protein FB567DRAFT_590472 [Paraphoma chrysanthemicola]
MAAKGTESRWVHLLDNIPGDLPEDKPIIMTNLLKFHDQARYPLGSPFTPTTGLEAWTVRYVKEYYRIGNEAGGLQLVYLGLGGATIVGETGEKWDAVALVKYPNIDTFRRAIGGEEYKEAALVHRDAALADWKLIATTEVKVEE